MILPERNKLFTISVRFLWWNRVRSANFFCSFFILLLFLSNCSGIIVADAADTKSRIVVNGVALTGSTIRELQQIYPAPIPPGRYWYDHVSGAYGRDGEPILGQMMPGLRLGGPMPADASRGTSRVFINGRQLTVGEKSYIEQSCQTPVLPGRYWVTSSGLGGYEGMSASFNLALCKGTASQNHGSSSSTRTFCSSDGSCTSSGILGSILTAPR
jgi:hypothetical protein